MTHTRTSKSAEGPWWFLIVKLKAPTTDTSDVEPNTWFDEVSPDVQKSAKLREIRKYDPLGPLGFDLAQHSPTSVEKTAQKAFMLSDRV